MVLVLVPQEPPNAELPVSTSQITQAIAAPATPNARYRKYAPTANAAAPQEELSAAQTPLVLTFKQTSIIAALATTSAPQGKPASQGNAVILAEQPSVTQPTSKAS